MDCPECSSEIPPDANFCGICGVQLKNCCASCGTENPLKFRFCGECGQLLVKATTTTHERRSHEPPALGEGERRQLTVLFSDLVNSTEIAGRLDPEEWRDMVAEYQALAAEAVARFGGHIAQYLGDGLMVFFGYPEAHENAAEAAVRASLRIVDALAGLNSRFAQSGKPSLAVRIGIHAGPVVVGYDGSKGTMVFGEPPNVAARVQDAAEPNSVFITSALHRLVSGLFVVDDRGANQLKGLSNPVQLFRVVRPTGVRGRLQALAAHSLTPFMGREEELSILHNRWERVSRGDGQAVVVVGEAGIGKSRLLHEFRSCIRESPHTWMESAGEQFFEHTPFHPIRRMLEQWLIGQAEGPEERVERLERALKSANLEQNEAVPLIAELLNLPLPDRYSELRLPSEEKRSRLFAILAEWVFGAALLQPLVIVFEDLHWADPSSLEWVQMILEQGAAVPLLLLFSARPEFRIPWPMRAHHTQLTLNRLSDYQVRRMVREVAARAALTPDTIEAVVKRATGVPLFIEELTLLVAESRTSATGHEIPATLSDSLMARLDRLGPAREIAQMGAAIGAEFSYELISTVVSMPETELQTGLDRLSDAGLLYTQGSPPKATYIFKHALIREAAYEALLKSRRRELHREIAHAIVEKFPAMAETQPEVLGRHWMAAGETEAAIAAWTRAGDSARWRYAFREAEEAYRQALALVNTLPESSRRDELELQPTCGQVLVLSVTRGYAAQETVNMTVRARRLSEKSGAFRQLFVVITGAGNAAVSGGQYVSSSKLADEALELAEREGSSTYLAIAHRLQLEAHFYRGDPVGAERYFNRGKQFFATPKFKRAAGGFVSALGHAAFSAWMTGHADTARERSRAAIAHAHEIKSHFDEAFALHMEAVLQMQLRDPEKAEEAAAEAINLSDHNGFPQFAAQARIPRGWARMLMGQPSEGIALIREGLAACAERSSRVAQTLYLSSLAEAQGFSGSIVEALETIERALEENPEEIAWRPHIFVVRGQLHVMAQQVETAESDFHEAITLAREAGSKSYELRAGTNLARLLASHGEREQAVSILKPVYNSFTEGFDLADLKAAKELLSDLAT